MILQTQTRPYLAVPISAQSSYFHCPTMSHLIKARQSLNSLKRTAQFDMQIRPGDNTQPTTFVDLRYLTNAGNKSKRLLWLLLQYENEIVATSTSLQECVRLSSTVVEYVVLSEAAKKLPNSKICYKKSVSNKNRQGLSSKP